MSVYVNTTFRIKRSALQQEAMQKLVAVKLFDGYKDILMISAIIGYNQRKYSPIEKAASDGVLMQFFSQKDYDIMDLIAYAHKKEQAVIKSDEKYEIFSSYANGGFPILLSKLDFDVTHEYNTDDTREKIVKYYSLLLSNGFNIDVTNDDLFL